jgi:hypothetical protein
MTGEYDQRQARVLQERDVSRLLVAPIRRMDRLGRRRLGLIALFRQCGRTLQAEVWVLRRAPSGSFRQFLGFPTDLVPPRLPPREAQHRHGPGGDEEDQLQAHKPKIIARPNQPALQAPFA